MIPARVHLAARRRGMAWPLTRARSRPNGCGASAYSCPQPQMMRNIRRVSGRSCRACSNRAGPSAVTCGSTPALEPADGRIVRTPRSSVTQGREIRPLVLVRDGRLIAKGLGENLSGRIAQRRVVGVLSAGANTSSAIGATKRTDPTLRNYAGGLVPRHSDSDWLNPVRGERQCRHQAELQRVKSSVHRN